MTTRRLTLQLVVVGTMWIASIECAPAQQASQSQARGTAVPAADALQEIVVTAEKRSSTVQTTPLSISALTGQDLQNMGLSGTQAIAQAVPGIAVASAGPGQAQYEIRGVSADGGEAPTVGFYVDEIPVTPPIGSTIGKSAIDPDLYDLARVEVLRGPQGTLYGAGSMGGTIKLVSSPPDPSGTYGSAQSFISGTEGAGLNYGQRAMLNLPLVKDVLALRLVGTYEHTSGWIDRVVVPNFPLETNPSPNFPVYGTARGNVLGVPGSQTFRNVNDEGETAGRATLVFAPSEQLTITSALMYQKITQGGMNTYDSTPGTQAHYEPFDIAEPFSDLFTLYSLTVAYDFGAFNVTSATGYWTRRSTQIQDASEATQNTFQLPAYSLADGGLGPVVAHEFNDTRQFSQEVRASGETGRLRWLLGGFYSDYKWSLDNGAIAPTLLSSPASPFQFDSVVQVNLSEPLRQSALFGNLRYSLTKELNLTLGGRYFHFTNTSNVATSGIIFGSDSPVITQSTALDSGFNPMADLAYAPTANSLYYFRAAKGFREGAGNPPLTGGPVGQQCLQDLKAIGLTNVPAMYQPDQVWSYELGEKNRLFDDRITLNGDVYFLNWTKIQTPVALPCGLPFVENAGQAHITGGELELQALLLPHLMLTQNLGYTHAYFTQGVADAVVSKGQNLFNVPRWTTNTVLRFEHPIADGLRGTLTATNSFVSSQTDLTYSINTLSSRDLVGLRLGIEGTSWSADLFASNVLDRRYAIENINLISFTGPPYNRAVSNQPRTIGLTFDIKF